MNKEIYEEKPSAMKAYLSNYGWHFNKAMHDWAVSMMRGRDGKPVRAYTRETLEELFKKNNTEIKTPHIYDALYVANMCVADYLGSSVPNEMCLVKFVNDYMEDPDGYKGKAFVRFYADTCVNDDCTIYWEDLL